MDDKIKEIIEKQTILIIDDDIISLEILLSELGGIYNVKVTTDPLEALDIIRSTELSLILLDVEMPKIDGFELCQIIKDDKKMVNLPIIFITGKDNIEDKYKGFTLGGVDYLVKPFHIKELMVRISSHIQLYNLQQSLEKQVKIETQKNLINNKLLVQKSRQSEIGEMMMHIAHQWKQPISELGSINLYHQLYYENNENSFDTKQLQSDLQKASDILDFMSNTVETFQNFFLATNAQKSYCVSEAIEDALKIVDATYHFHGFKIEFEKNDNIMLFGKRNEYSQVVLAILNNIKNIFIQRDVENPIVIIKVDKKDEKSIVTIEDNGGGIDKKIIDDIFLPYISGTKTSGIGLYMAQEIVQKQGGIIIAENIKNGAKFTISI
jgi:CheY-like chemotaxis protein